MNDGKLVDALGNGIKLHDKVILTSITGNKVTLTYCSIYKIMEKSVVLIHLGGFYRKKRVHHVDIGTSRFSCFTKLDALINGNTMKLVANQDLANYLTAGNIYEGEVSDMTDEITSYYVVETDDGVIRVVDVKFFEKLNID